jgi:Brp/Blh family beta-carotene 15,15'-monooxygenase
MFSFSNLVTERVAEGNLSEFNKINVHSKSRFKFYDNLLLIILLRWPSLGKKIFTSLFHKVSIRTIFSFLEEKTSLNEEIKIFANLPIKPFLKALFLYLNEKHILRYIIAFVIVAIYTILSFKYDQIAQNFNYLVLIVGLLWVGIPHGALDHLLSKNKKTSLSIFIVKYLFLIALYLLLWQFSPMISLFVFIVYSSFHFGESELIQNKEQINSLSKFFKAFFLGLSILLFIISSHLEESLNILSSLNIKFNTSLFSLNLDSVAHVVSFASLTFIFLNSLLSKSVSFIGILILLVLGIQVPLTLAFGLYFIAQHSYHAWFHLRVGLNLSSRQLYVKSSPLTFSALLIFFFVAFFIRDSINPVGIWANFFVFISCISFPHFILMHLFYSSKKEFN